MFMGGAEFQRQKALNRAGWECMLQLQESEDRKTPAATTWAAGFLLRAGKQGVLRVVDQLRRYS
jgi:hypothetical protein